MEQIGLMTVWKSYPLSERSVKIELGQSDRFTPHRMNLLFRILLKVYFHYHEIVVNKL